MGERNGWSSNKIETAKLLQWKDQERRWQSELRGNCKHLVPLWRYQWSSPGSGAAHKHWQLKNNINWIQKVALCCPSKFWHLSMMQWCYLHRIHKGDMKIKCWKKLARIVNPISLMSNLLRSTCSSTLPGNSSKSSSGDGNIEFSIEWIILSSQSWRENGPGLENFLTKKTKMGWTKTMIQNNSR